MHRSKLPNQLSLLYFLSCPQQLPDLRTPTTTVRQTTEDTKHKEYRVFSDLYEDTGAATLTHFVQDVYIYLNKVNLNQTQLHTTSIH